MKRPADILRYWLPVLAWTCVIAALSSPEYSSFWSLGILEKIVESFSLSLSEFVLTILNALVRSGAHVFAYGFFSFLVFRAWRAGHEERWRWSWALATFLLTVAVAAADELNQSRFLTRRGSFYCLGFDVLGCLMALGWVRASAGWLRPSRAGEEPGT